MTFSEAAMIMMSGGGSAEPVIQPLTVTENRKYEVPAGVDGFNPVSVNVPDRYDEGYQDGYNRGYDDGFKIADEFFNRITDPDKNYTLTVNIYYAFNDPNGFKNVRFIVQSTDGAYWEEDHYVDGTWRHSYDAKVTNIEWGSKVGELFFTLIGYDSDGNVYTDRYQLQAAVSFKLSSSNTNIVIAQ